MLVGGVVAGSLLLMVGLALFATRARKPITDVMTACVQHEGIGMHIHPRLAMRIDGAERPIPSGIGLSPGCMRPLHTHDDTGTIHLEFPIPQEVRLGQFFTVWGQPFSKDQILDRAIGSDDLLRVTVNGNEVSELEQLLLRDREEIVLEVRKKTSEDNS